MKSSYNKRCWQLGYAEESAKSLTFEQYDQLTSRLYLEISASLSSLAAAFAAVQADLQPGEVGAEACCVHAVHVLHLLHAFAHQKPQLVCFCGILFKHSRPRLLFNRSTGFEAEGWMAQALGF